jgi:hypothetical protein
MDLAMSEIFRVIVAIGLLVSTGTKAQEPVCGRGEPSRSMELCQAFPWDEPVEQTFTVGSVVRWRQTAPDVRRRQKPVHVRGF